MHSAYLVEETDFADDWGSNATSNKLRLMLFDGGNNRPKCHMNNTGCFSRACEYHLDTLAGTATLAWQFAYPYAVDGSASAHTQRHGDAYVSDGGSAVLFANDAEDLKVRALLLLARLLQNYCYHDHQILLLLLLLLPPPPTP